MDMKRFFLYGMMGAVLALAGCNGGGGGGTGMMSGTPGGGGGGTPPGGGNPGGGGGTTQPPPTPTPTNPVSLSELLMGYMTIPAGDITVPAGQSMDRGHARFSCPAGGAACMIMVAADGTVTSNRAGVTASPSDKAREDRAIIKAISLESGRGAIARPPDHGSFPPVGPELNKTPSQVVVTPETWDASWPVLQGIAIGRDANFSHPMSPTTPPAQLGDTLNQDDEGVVNAIEFMNQNMNTTLGQFRGEVHKRTMKDGNKTITDEITIYHDKQASGPVKWSEYYSRDSTVDSRTNRTTGPSGFGTNNGRPGVAAVTYSSSVDGRLDIKTHANNFLSAAETALFAAPNNNLPSAPSQTFTYSAAANTKPLTFPGTFHGVAGQYACTGTSCTVARDSKGENLRFGGSPGAWTFTPTEPTNEILLPGLGHDTDYLVFGYWLEKTTTGQPGQDPTYRLGSIYEGSKLFGTDLFVNVGTPGPGNPVIPKRDNNAIAALRGKATYKGSAAGKYGLRTFDRNGGVRTSSARSFTAKATLTAQFDDTSGEVSLNDRLSIKGTITEFTDPQNPGTDLSAWSVELQRAKFGFRNTTGVATNRQDQESRFFPRHDMLPRSVASAGGGTRGMTGTTPGPVLQNNADWNGQFFGPVYNAATARPGQTAENTYPTGVTGTFKANFTNGTAYGAYGATLQE